MIFPSAYFPKLLMRPCLTIYEPFPEFGIIRELLKKMLKVLGLMFTPSNTTDDQLPARLYTVDEPGDP